MESRPLQLMNALFPMLVTLSGIVKSPVRPLQPMNALFPMLVTPSGIVKSPVRPLQL